MDYAISGSIFTILVFVCFIGIVLWAFNKKTKKRFDEAQNLIFDDEPQTNKQESKLDE